MATDYILFIHGVNTRNRQDYKVEANQMFQNIRANIQKSSRTLQPIFLFWGDIAEESTRVLREGLEASPKWNEFWFQDLRSNQVIPFVGDAAMYLSRFVSSKIVQNITDQAIKEIENPLEGDRLHLVTHSWGTVILFDILFAPRWDDVDSIDTRELVKNIRRAIFGIGENEVERNQGIPLASIHTMGSPIALFNLVNIQEGKAFNLTPKLKEFLEALHQKMRKPLPWRNYAHAGDPIAYPLEGMMPLFLDQARNLVDIKDVMSPTGIGRVFGQTNIPIINLLPIVSGGNAHGSYWKERGVAKKIGEIIASSRLRT
jgi:hypothetical protein